MRSFFEFIHRMLYFLTHGWTYSLFTTETSISQHRQQPIFRHCWSVSLWISHWRMETHHRINDDFKFNFSLHFASCKPQIVKGRKINYLPSHVFRRSTFRYAFQIKVYYLNYNFLSCKLCKIYFKKISFFFLFSYFFQKSTNHDLNFKSIDNRSV